MATYTDQQILDQARQALVDALAGKRVRFNDGSVDRWVESEDVAQIQAVIEKYQARVNAAAARAARTPTFGGLTYSVARLDGN